MNDRFTTISNLAVVISAGAAIAAAILRESPATTAAGGSGEPRHERKADGFWGGLGFDSDGGRIHFGEPACDSRATKRARGRHPCEIAGRAGV